jgi:hypothetical protein
MTTSANPPIDLDQFAVRQNTVIVAGIDRETANAGAA